MRYAAVAALFILICPIGVPIGLLWKLCRLKQRGELYSEDEGDGKFSSPHPKAKFLGSLFMQFAPHAYYFEVVHMAGWGCGGKAGVGSSCCNAIGRSGVDGHVPVPFVSALLFASAEGRGR